VGRVEIVVNGGDGGDGIASFRREKFVPFGGPDGGDGGVGGNVYAMADRSVTSLGEFRRKRRFKAAAGKRGGKQKKHGARGDDLVIMVPLGTAVSLEEDGQEALLADLSEQGQKVLVAKGGNGGLGNPHFATARNQAPRIATKGKTGEERRLVLDLKLIADVGIIGYPNVGKSTLLAAVSKARPKIADYPFTTREPVVGVAGVGMKTFVVAEVPGLVDGACLGRGLGHDFLRHVDRTRVLLHLLDGSSASVTDDMNNLNTELALYKPTLAQKCQIVAVNKIDLPEVKARMPELKRTFGSVGVTIFFISAVTKQGVPYLLRALAEMVDIVGDEETVSETPVAVFRPKPKARRGKWI
jgi:GTP-binding protein